MEAAYWDAETFSDLDGSWSPSSSASQYSDQENHQPAPPQSQCAAGITYSGADANQNILDISGALNQAYGIFCELEQNPTQNGSVVTSQMGQLSSAMETSSKHRSGTNPGSDQDSQKKGKHPVKRVHQRNAANMRERRRMKTINDAFEGLRERIPLASGDRKLSKVDTLRLAIRYIHNLSDMVNACDNVGSMGRGHQEATKVIIRYPTNNTGYHGYCEDPYTQEQYQLYGHSLSWQQHKPIGMAVDNKLSAKVWTPNMPTTQELDEMQNYVS